MPYKLILSTCPDLTSAHALAEELVKLEYAACVNIIPTIVSIYKWENNVEQSAECQLFIKTNEINWPKVESYIKQNHPYDVPEIVAVDLTHGYADYFSWMDDNLKQGEL